MRTRQQRNHDRAKVVAVMIGLIGATGAAGRAESVDRDKLIQIKAAYLINFARFTTWPSAAFESERSPLVIGVVGDGAIASALQQSVEGRAIEGHPLAARRLGKAPPDGDAAAWNALAQGARACHVVYFDDESSQRVHGMLRRLSDAPVLTVGESETFVRRGGMLSFMMHEGRVIFCADPKAIAASGLQLSSRVLKLARIITPHEEGRP